MKKSAICKCVCTALTLLVIVAAVALAACQPTAVTATFNPNYSGGALLPQTGNVGGNISVPNVTRKDYTFEGWFKDEACTQPFEEGVDDVFQTDVQFYAKWKANPVALEVTAEENTVPYGTEQSQVEAMLAVAARYADNEHVDVSEFTVDGYQPRKAGEQHLTVSSTVEGFELSADFSVVVANPLLVSISVTYSGGDVLVGSEPDAAQIEVVATFEDDSTRVLTAEEYTLDGFNKDTIGTQTVTVSATIDGVTKTDEFTVEVFKRAVSSITVTYSGGDLFVGDEPDLSRLSVTAIYNDRSSQKISVADCVVEGFETQSAGTKTVTVTYTTEDGTFTDSFTFRVLAVEVTHITAVYDGTVFVNGQLDNGKVTVTAHYNNGTTQPVEQWTVSSADTSSAGTKQLTVTARVDEQEYTCQLSVTVVEPKLTGIDALYSGRSVFAGEEISKQDITVTAHYEDNSSKTIADFTLDAYKIEVGKNTLTVRFTDKGITQTATFVVTGKHADIQSIEAVYDGNEQELYEGRYLNESDFTVTGHYADGSQKVLPYNAPNFSVNGSASTKLTSAGQCVVTISYTETWQDENGQTQSKTVTATVTLTVGTNKPTALTCTYVGIEVYYNQELEFTDENLLVQLEREHSSSKERLNVGEYTTTYSTIVEEDGDNGYVEVTYVYRPGTEFEETFTCRSTFKVVLLPVRLEVTLDGPVKVGQSIGMALTTAEILIYYNNGTCKPMDKYDGFATIDPDSFDQPGHHTVHLVYGKTLAGEYREVTFELEVDVEPLILESITAEYLGGDVFVGDGVDPSDVKVMATYDFGDPKQVTGFTLAPAALSELGEQKVTVSYEEGDVSATATFTVNVVPWQLDGISAEYRGGTLEVGAQPDLSQLVVTAHYTHGKTKQVADFELSAVNTSKHGTKVATVTYEENGKSVECSCQFTVVHRAESISAKGPETAWVGDELGKNNVAVTVTFNDGCTEATTDFTLSVTELSAEGTTEVTVSASVDGKQLSATFSVNVRKVVLESITAEYLGGDVFVGEQPDESKLQVTAHYSNGTQRTVNANHDTVDSSAPGTVQWNISYTEDGVTVSTTVQITVVNPGPQEPREKDYDVNVIKQEDLSIHFLMLGNKNTGDSVYIKAGETDILIDAGSDYNSASTIANYINQYCTDGKLEYVVASHAHMDHIAGFVTYENNGGGIFDRFECDNIIKYARKNSTSNVSKNFEKAVDDEKAAGANVYTANDCINNINGAQKEYTLAEGISMEILDQKYYRTNTSNENNYSVCLMIKQGENNYLFTGDLEGDGETSLVQLNPDLPTVKLWKGGHHGSYTAGSTELLEKIRPETVCICTCMGTTEYTTGEHVFPAKEFVERVSQYTDRVYCTSDGTKYSGSKECIPANGNIVFACTNEQITMYFSNNNLKLKETDWFKSTSWFQNNPNIHESWRS